MHHRNDIENDKVNDLDNVHIIYNLERSYFMLYDFFKYYLSNSYAHRMKSFHMSAKVFLERGCNDVH
jgi:hypothetical protein